MDAENDLTITIDQLAQSDVIAIGKDDTVTLSSTFEEMVTEHELSFRYHDARALADEFVDVTTTDEARQLGTIGVNDRLFVAIYRALADSIKGLNHEERLQTVISLAHIRDTQPRLEGVPAAFLPVRGDQIETLLKLYPKVVLYIWKEDCDPCDTVRSDLDEIFEETPDDIALLSVYGTDSATLLHDLFDVPGAPTTLFIENGSVVVRLYGAHHTEVYEREVHDLRHGPMPVDVEDIEPRTEPES